MIPCDKFTTQLLRESDSIKEPLVQLILKGKKVGPPIKGAYLEKQYCISGLGYLLFLTDDVPYEETLRIYLVNENAEVVDGLEFGSSMATGTLEIVDVENEDSIVFSFIHEALCKLQVLKTAQWCKPLIFTPGVQRSGAFKRHHLKLSMVMSCS
ncbi:MAG: hypothetical protein ACI88H_004222 [Cocleimonas sp.]|jgi:hypothetical protein